MIQSIVACIEYHIHHQTDEFQFHIRWRWSLEQKVIETSKLYPNYVIYHGRESFDNIKKKIQTFQYSIMPSIFLETFWLTALESCMLWLPVVGYAKWWLKQFILSQYDCTDKGLTNILQYIVSKFDANKHYYEQDIIKKLATNYNDHNRYNQFQTICLK